ncbi:HlyD family efflux transporter periplasmic adaptor subunit [Lutimonas halocynthiae]|uniref:HlyD family secretion protein n=1 Tax=Lutimonas halocynthiae TaxID=1446477 RepID=UPI0025B566F8|nr:HlyD family efflux transporter periplasmic adaptor subunit [Lutimonas halocynthiae]MDN3641448.1 HlyD family efflux transporter periplasmic adaptor subunit [Lutimonas halocynthiae]
MKNILPKEVITESIEYHRHRFLRKSHIVYSVLLIGLIILAFLLPIIHIDLYSASPGMIRPQKEMNLINSPINGKVEQVNIEENSFVHVGDTLLMLDDREVSKAIQRLTNQLDSLRIKTHDLQYLIKTTYHNSDSIVSALHKSHLQEYQHKTKSLKDNLNWITKDLRRQEQLFKRGVISKKEFENSLEQFEAAKNALLLCRSQQKRIWQNELQTRQSEIRILHAQQLELEKNKSLHYIVAPVEGTIQDLVGIDKNNFLYTGSSIAHISPKTDLLVECYVKPTDIGMIKKNHPVSFQIDAFDHNYWGSATGKIVQISDDNLFINKMPMYKVICSMNESSLVLGKNIRGKLKKGMTLNARFFIANRSLIQLLFDKLNDWY